MEDSMGGGRKWLLLLVVLIVAVLLLVYRCVFTNCTPPTVSTTHLTMDSEGGFAYVKVPAADEIDIAFLKDTHVTDCEVDQLGVKLMVAKGTLIEPNTQPIDGFDLGGATITFGDFGSTTAPLVANRGPVPPPSPGQPADPTDEAQWTDLKWVASVKDHYQAALSSTWMNKIDGRVRVTRGTLIGLHPSDLVAQKGVWEFKGGQNAPAPFIQAMTDATRYTVDVSGEQVVVRLDQARSNLSQIVVRADANHQVVLKMVGVHANTPSAIPPGTPIHHYCAFYQLIDPVPASTAWLIPYWKGDPKLPSNKGQGSPGGLCPGDYFP
jgi:hypothetical protein